MCRTKGKGECRVESVVYKIWCGKCEGEGRRRIYVGETGRSAWERGKDHLKAWREKEEGSFMWKHQCNEHGEDGMEEGDIKMEVIGKPRKALQRQVEEAVRIGEEKPGEVMNSKKEFGHNKIPRIRIGMGDEVRGRREEWERVKKGGESQTGGGATQGEGGQDMGGGDGMYMGDSG